MLVLMRRAGESIIIDGHIRVTVVSVQGERVRLAIDAPPEIRVDRQEVHERRLCGEIADVFQARESTTGPAVYYY